MFQFNWKNKSVNHERNRIEKGRNFHSNKEGLVVWVGAIIIRNEGYVNLIIWVYSGYPDTCKDHKVGSEVTIRIDNRS